MSTKFIEHCPACGEEMYISTLKCKGCGIEIKGEFEKTSNLGTSIDEFKNSLSSDELEFIKAFLKYEGNISRLQEELGIGYFAVKSKLKEVNITLGNELELEMDDCKTNIESEDKGLASKRIIDLLKQSGGKAECPMLKGDPLTIWLTNEGVKNSGFANFVCEWNIFDAIVEKTRELGGKMYRGDSAAQNGAKIGSPELPLDSIDAYISIEFYGNQEGKSTLRRSTYYAAILAWAGICKNKRAGHGEPGHIELLPNWMEK